jgi:hypothetical protein
MTQEQETATYDQPDEGHEMSPYSEREAPDLAAIRARAEAATEGPWGSPDTALAFISNRSGPIMWAGREYATVEDAEFIAHARTDIPALLALLESYRPAHEVADAWDEGYNCGAADYTDSPSISSPAGQMNPYRTAFPAPTETKEN